MPTSRTPPDLSGLWQANLEKSTFRGPAPQEILVRLVHREPTLTQSMRLIAADGSRQEQTFTYHTDGRATPIRVGSGDGEIRAHWDGAELIVETVLQTPGRTFRFSDHWSLSADGRTLQMAHPDDDLAGQVAVLERASPADAARFPTSEEA